MGVDSWARLAETTPLELRTAPNLGLKSFAEIAGELLVAWATAQPNDQSVVDPFDAELEEWLDSPEEEEGVGESGWATLKDDAERALHELWRDSGASTLGDAIRISADVDVSPELTDSSPGQMPGSSNGSRWRTHPSRCSNR